MLHGSEKWSLKRENVLTLHWAEMTMIRWMCDVKLRDKQSCIELGQQLGIEDVEKVVQGNRLRWYGHVLRKDDDDWVKNMSNCGGDGTRQRNSLRRIWKEVVDKDTGMNDLH